MSRRAPWAAAGLLAFAWLAVRLSAQPVASYWLRLYPLPAYGSIWRMSLAVSDFNKSLPKITAALEKKGGEPVAPLANMAGSRKGKFQQLSYRLPAATAEAALAAVQKLGEVEELQKNPGFDPAVHAEVEQKLDQLKTESASNADALAKMPSILAAASEIRAHLEQVRAADIAAAGRVLLNLQVRERPSAAKH
jgi:hypothetical protein